MNMTELVEQWRPIEGYEGLYEVSNLGKVKSLERIDNRNCLRKEKILRPIPDKDGYLLVNLYKERKIKMFKIHRLVAQAFIPNPEGLPQINHKDEDKTNARADNLEWCDCRYNNRYGTRNERIVQIKIDNGTYDPELCGLDKKEHNSSYYHKNRERILKQKREQYQKNRDQINERRREQRLKKKQKQTT